MAVTQGRDALEGRYTQVEPEVAEGRVVHGQYTEGEGHTGPDPEISGAYVGTQRDGKPPIVRSTHQRIGNYPQAEHEAHQDPHSENEAGEER